MRLLIDTHIALWGVSNDPKLSIRARSLIADADSVTVSVVSIWEVSIKHGRRRHGVPGLEISGAQALAEFRNADFEILDITPEHAVAVDRLPPLHSDPFDRLLVAQALSEPLILLTHDRAVAAYGDTIVLV